MTVLQKLLPSPELAALLADYDQRGGALDFVLFDGTAALTEADLHRAAAIATVESIAAGYEAYFRKPETIQSCLDSGLDPDNHFRLVTDPTRAVGRPITVQEFVGPYFDWSSRRLFQRGQSSAHLNDYFLPGEAENAANARPQMILAGAGPFVTQGYADAFADPPYHLRGTALEVDALFQALNAALFDDLSEALVIYQWSTDWSNYFDSGQEWWGAFLWTVQNRGAGHIVGVAASTTD